MTASATAEAKNGHRLVSFDELSQLPPPFRDVPLPELGVEVRLYAINGLERTRLRDIAAKSGDDAQADLTYASEVIAASLPGSTVEGIAKLPSTVIVRLFMTASVLAGIGEAAVQEAVAALKATPSAESGSA